MYVSIFISVVCTSTLLLELLIFKILFSKIKIESIFKWRQMFAVVRAENWFASLITWPKTKQVKPQKAVASLQPLIRAVTSYSFAAINKLDGWPKPLNNGSDAALYSRSSPTPSSHETEPKSFQLLKPPLLPSLTSVPSTST